MSDAERRAFIAATSIFRNLHRFGTVKRFGILNAIFRAASIRACASRKAIGNLGFERALGDGWGGARNYT
jgi:hypothetical protein